MQLPRRWCRSNAERRPWCTWRACTARWLTRPKKVTMSHPPAVKNFDACASSHASQRPVSTMVKPGSHVRTERAVAVVRTLCRDVRPTLAVLVRAVLGLAIVDSGRVVREAEEVGLQHQRCQRRSFVIAVRSIRAKLTLVVAGRCLATGVEVARPTLTAPWRALDASRSEAKLGFAIQARRGGVGFSETAR